MGLNDSYSQARSQILLMHQLPSINQVYAMINQDESQKLVANSSRSLNENLIPTAMYTSRSGVANSRSKKPYNPNAFCDYCHMKGHMRSDCHKLLKCDYCHKTGHVKLDCFRLIGYPPDFKGKRDAVVAGNSIYEAPPISYQTRQHHMASSHQAAGSGLVPMPMITPEQHHKLLQMLDQTTIGDANGVANMAGHVQLPTGDSAKVSHIGDCHVGGGDFLRKVLCVPAFKFNLMSVSQVTKDLNCCVTFFPHYCVFQDLSSGKVRVTGEARDGLYILSTQVEDETYIPQRCLTVTQGVEDKAIVWHQRLCHVPMSVLRKIPNFHKFGSKFALHNCEVCPLARQTRLPFPHSTSRSTSSFQLLHLDVWGPYKVETFDGMRYFLTIVDDYSRWTWTFLMRLKSDVISLLKHFFIEVETQFGTKIQKVRSDNGSEFFNSNCNELFKLHGVIHESSCPYTPQQNGEWKENIGTS